MNFIWDKNGFFQKPPDNDHFEKARVNDRSADPQGLPAINYLLFDSQTHPRRKSEPTSLLDDPSRGSDADSITFTLTTQLSWASRKVDLPILNFCIEK